MGIELRRCVLPGVTLQFVCASSRDGGLLLADWLEVGPDASAPNPAQALPAPFRQAVQRAAHRARTMPVVPPFDPLDYLRDARCWRAPSDVPPGTEHARRVWRALCAIPVGETRSYGQIAREIDSSPRAVGQACKANPWPLFIPCHRVVSASPSGRAGVGGYAGDVGGALAGIKVWLLAHEASCLRVEADQR